MFKDNGYYTARISKIFHMGVPKNIETGSHGTDDAASWTERINSLGPEWKAEGEGELVQNNPYGNLPIKGGNVMTIVKAKGDDLVHSDAFSVTHGGESFLVRIDKWAYIQYDEGSGAGMELFDMETDSKQYNNLAHNPHYADVFLQMQARLKAKLEDVRDNDLNRF